VWEVNDGREFPKIPQYGKLLLEEKPLRSTGPTVWEVDGWREFPKVPLWEVEGGREFPKVPLYRKWLLGEKLCVGGGCGREFPLYTKW
jgi:hypothetical protein